MNNWFHDFKKAVTFGSTPGDLQGAGSATPDRALGHYRFQHEAKVKEAIAETFPVLLEYLQNDWEEIWKAFWKQNKVSPRSLDFFPEVFLTYFHTNQTSPELKELARFEHDLDIFPWTHKSLWPVEVGSLQENSRIEIGPFEIKEYACKVTALYDQDGKAADTSETIILWMKGESVHFREVSLWEINVLQTLMNGMNEALDYASDDPEEVTEFFKWLGSSNLIRSIY